MKRALTVGLAVWAIGLAVIWALNIGGSPDYRVTAMFLNASQLVKGAHVVIGGNPVGTVSELRITGSGQAAVTFDVDRRWAPLRRGTKAVVRLPSQAGMTNRVVQLLLPESAGTAPIPNGGTIGTEDTTTAVEWDQVFNVFDRPTRRAMQRFYTRGDEMMRGHAHQLAAAYHYLNPTLATSVDLFKELNYDEPVLERFLVDTSRLVTDLADRKKDLGESVETLNRTFRALASNRVALADAIKQLPPVMRRANTTFVNTKVTLDKLDPFINASKPVAKALKPWLREVGPTLREAGPLIKQLNPIVARPGRANDLIDLTRSFEPLARVSLDRQRINGALRDGALPETTRALNDSTDIVAFGRPYTTDLFAVMDDYSNILNYDALGPIVRGIGVADAFSVQSGIPTLIKPNERGAEIYKLLRTGQYRRCPGGAEVPLPDGSNVLGAAEQRALDCRESDRAMR